MRKISTKPQVSEERLRKLELRNTDNEYYLPHPQIRIVKTPIKESPNELQKDKPFIKYPRKTSHNGPLRTFSTANFKTDVNNLSKQQDLPSSQKHHAAKKVQTRKIRCNSNCETPRKTSSKSCFKVQLNNVRKDTGSKRLNLKIETPTTKKGEKADLKEMNFDSYYNNDCVQPQSKTTRAMKRPLSSQGHLGSNSQFATVFNRCKKLIEQYQQQLEEAKRENRALQQQNAKLKDKRQQIRQG